MKILKNNLNTSYQKHLSLFNREDIEKLLKAGFKFYEIANKIQKHKTTISNILRKNGFLVYDVDKWVKYLYYRKDFLNVIKNIFPEVFENNVFNKRKLGR